MSDADREFLLIGAGGHAKAVVDAVMAAGGRIACYVDTQESGWLEADRIASDENAGGIAPSAALVLGIGGVSPDALERRLQLLDGYLAGSRSAPAVVHPAAHVSEHARLAEGVTILAGAVVQPGATVGRGSIVNTGAVVEHDAEIGEGSHVAPGAIVLGDCTVGRCCMVGAGAVVLQGEVVDDHSLIAAGTRFPR